MFNTKIFIDAVYRNNKSSYSQAHLGECKYKVKKTVKRFITNSLTKSDTDSEDEPEYKAE